MSNIVIKEVSSRRDLHKFIDFTESLYKDNPYYVPQLFFDQVDTLDPKRNPASAFCESALFLAYKDGKLAGRVAAIVNHRANQQWNHKEVRFGWYDFIDDREVSAALMAKVEEFGKQRGMTKIAGPLGFTDFDPEGMLIAGYDRLSTMALIYNHPYYVDHVEALGFTKDVDWMEFKLQVPDKLPDKFTRVAQLVKQREKLHYKRLTKRIVKKEGYGQKIFKLVNECYKHLYDFTVLPEDLADKYLGFYLSILDLDYVTMIENEKNELVAFGITMPSIVKALQKSRGKLFPFGWVHLLKSLFIKHEEGVEMLLIGVRPDYQNRGINSLIFDDLYPRLKASGAKWTETNAVLESNVKCQANWIPFEHECVKRRRSYAKKL